jgi:hypothetical protein
LCLPSASKNKENQSESSQLNTINRLEEQTYSHWSFIVVRSNHNKTEKRLEKIIPWQQHHLRLGDVAVRKSNSPCRHAEEVADAVVVTLIFVRVTMEKPNPPYLFTIARKEETNQQYKETWRGL